MSMLWTEKSFWSVSCCWTIVFHFQVFILKKHLIVDRYELAKASLEKNAQQGTDLKLHAFEKIWESQVQNEAKIRQKKELRYASNAVKIKLQEQQLV